MTRNRWEDPPGDLFAPLLEEHASLRRLLRELEASRHRPERFLSLLRRHTDREDRVLYPLCEQLFDGERGAVSVLRRDHDALARIARTLEDSGRRETIREMVPVLYAHLSREELVLFPFLRRVLPEGEALRLRRRLEGATSG